MHAQNRMAEAIHLLSLGHQVACQNGRLCGARPAIALAKLHLENVIVTVCDMKFRSFVLNY